MATTMFDSKEFHKNHVLHFSFKEKRFNFMELVITKINSITFLWNLK